MLRPNYRCKQQELYTISRLGWNSCKQHIADFADLKAKYTVSFIQDRLNEVNAAAILPDDQARTEKSEIYRIQLLALAKNGTDLFLRLKRYIVDAYSNPAIQKAKIDSAGQYYMEKATQNNWDSVQGLLTSASNFIANNLSDLQANQNMPATFQAQFDQVKDSFLQLHTEFLDSEEIALQQTQQKVQANNEIYATLMKMFADGVEIFKNDEAISKQFVFSEVLYLASGVGTAGIKGYITDANTGAALDEVSISLIAGGKVKSTLSDADGRFEILQVAAGIYQLKIEKTGYEPYFFSTQEVKLGVTSSVNVGLSVAA